MLLPFQDEVRSPGAQGSPTIHPGSLRCELVSSHSSSSFSQTNAEAPEEKEGFH